MDQKVWLYNYCLKTFPRKLKSRWDGPYTIREIFSNGDVLILDQNQVCNSKSMVNELNPM